MGVMPTHFVFIFYKTLRGNFAESFIQNFSSLSKLPIFEKRCFFKNCPKNLTKAENFKNFLSLLVTILSGISMVYCMFWYFEWFLRNKDLDVSEMGCVLICYRVYATISTSAPSHLVKLSSNPKQRTGLQFLSMLCFSDRQKCRHMKKWSGLVSFFANPD